jgi:hypothetical protein
MPDEADEFAADYASWAHLDKGQKDLAKRADELKTKLKARLAALGYTDAKGNKLVDLPPLQVGDKVHIQAKLERRVTFTPDTEAAEHLARKAGVYDRLFPAVPTFDPQVVYQLLQEGLFSEIDVDTVFPEKETWALCVVTA